MNSFNSKSFYTAEELGTVTPWRMPSVDDERVLVAAVDETEAGSVLVSEEEVDCVPRLTADEIEAMQQQAYAEAAAQGRAEGHKQGHDDGYREGYAEGRRQGLAQGESELRQQAETLEQLLTALDQPLREVDELVEQELVALAVAMTKQLVRRELKTDPGQIVAVVREALAVLPSGARKISVVLHPEDAERVRAALSLDERGQRWKLIEDPLVTRGGCRVTSENSSIDATVEKRLAAVIARAFGGDRGGDES